MQDAAIDDVASLEEGDENFPDPADERASQKEEDVVQEWMLNLIAWKICRLLRLGLWIYHK